MTLSRCLPFMIYGLMEEIAILIDLKGLVTFQTNTPVLGTRIHTHLHRYIYTYLKSTSTQMNTLKQKQKKYL